MSTIFRTSRRHPKGTVIDVYGARFTFGADGFGTLETDDLRVIGRLLEIPEGFEIAGGSLPEPDPVVKDAKGAKEAKGANDYVLTNGDATLDLSALDDDALANFAEANGLDIDKRRRGDKRRAQIVELLAAKG